jgi:hypothetical protein
MPKSFFFLWDHFSLPSYLDNNRSHDSLKGFRWSQCDQIEKFTSFRRFWELHYKITQQPPKVWLLFPRYKKYLTWQNACRDTFWANFLTHLVTLARLPKVTCLPHGPFRTTQKYEEPILKSFGTFAATVLTRYIGTFVHRYTAPNRVGHLYLFAKHTHLLHC